MFAEASGILAVALATAWMIYVVFIKKPVDETTTITVADGFDKFMRKGDFVTINNEQFEIVEIKNTQMKVRKG